MGQDQADAGAKPAGTNTEKLNQVLRDNQFISIDLRDKFISDAMGPASDSLGQRLLTVTKEAVTQVPQAFVNSFDAKNILPNVGIGFGIGSAMKVALPETGPVGKAAGGALAAWFVGKPLVESYYMAATATTNADMYNASHHLAETVGGLPVTAVEAAAGAKLGSMAAGKFMGSAIAEPLVAWKAKQYERLDTKIDSGDVALKNAAARDMGLGNNTRFQNKDNAYDDGNLDSGIRYERGHGPNYREFRSNPPQRAKADDGYERLDTKIDTGDVALKNAASRDTGLGNNTRFQNKDNAYDDGNLDSGVHYERGHGPNYMKFRSNPLSDHTPAEGRGVKPPH